MSFTPEFLARIDFAAESINFQQANLVNIVEHLSVPLLQARQDLARKIRDGVQPEDEVRYEQMFENVNKKLVMFFGFNKKDEDDGE